MKKEMHYAGAFGTNYKITKDDELCHFGVLRMKWGIRRYQNEDGSYKPGAEGRYAQKTNGNKRTTSEDYEKSRAKSRKEMSDDELKSAVNRLNNERQYEQYKKELSKADEESAPKKEEKKKDKESKEHKISTKFKSEQLSDEELDNAINRLNKEKQYRQLVEESKSPVSRAFTKAAKTFAKTMFDATISSIDKSIKDSMSSDKVIERTNQSAARAKKMAGIGLEQIRRQRERLKG